MDYSFYVPSKKSSIFGIRTRPTSASGDLHNVPVGIRAPMNTSPTINKLPNEIINLIGSLSPYDPQFPNEENTPQNQHQNNDDYNNRTIAVAARAGAIIGVGALVIARIPLGIDPNTELSIITVSLPAIWNVIGDDYFETIIVSISAVETTLCTFGPISGIATLLSSGVGLVIRHYRR